MSNMFPEIKKNFGFGVMRLPMVDGDVVHEDFCRMVDAFMHAGFNYFDTARVYLSGKSEIALRECLVKRYAREDFVLVDKLSNSCFEKEEEIRPFFESQLESLGTDYIDIWLMHAQNAASFEKYKNCRAYETAQELKAEGKIRHYGLSFHDTADVLDKILTEYPSVEVVQLQFNYLDFEDERVQARLCYETCVRHGKPVIVMEPVRGGALANLPPVARKHFEELGDNMSPASYAIRFAAGFDNVMMVLSGMSNIEQVKDNISYMADFIPLSEREKEAVDKVCKILRNSDIIRCTGCAYCVDGCPANINIPAHFAVSNAKVLGGEAEAVEGGAPADCLKCGQCEEICPQKLKITELLEKI
ncbi:MAG: aldo/keto reductase [Clostridia bacterium]|nr:aldo/keto reductase [Clostridia bacterium]